MTFQTFFIWVGVVLNENEKKREKKFNTMCISQSKFKVTSVVIESEWQKRSRLKQMTGFYMECDIGLKWVERLGAESKIYDLFTFSESYRSVNELAPLHYSFLAAIWNSFNPIKANVPLI